MNRCFLKVSGFLLGVLLISAPGITLAASPYFKGKTVRLLVGFRPGGGTDIQARYFASRWPTFIPGNPRIIVTNLPPNIAAKTICGRSSRTERLCSLSHPVALALSLTSVHDLRPINSIGSVPMPQGIYSGWFVAMRPTAPLRTVQGRAQIKS